MTEAKEKPAATRRQSRPKEDPPKKAPVAKAQEDKQLSETENIRSVHDALQHARIELCGSGIEKNRQAPDAVGGYNFRGIDDLYNVVGPLLAKYGISIAPQVKNVEHNVYERTRRGRDGEYTTLTHHYVVRVQYLVCTEKDYFHVEVYGEAADGGDKGINKAMTSAYKNAVFQLLAPPLASSPVDMDDPANSMPRDSERDHVAMEQNVQQTVQALAEEKRPTTGGERENCITIEQQHEVQAMVKAAGGNAEKAVFTWLKIPTGKYELIPTAAFDRLVEQLTVQIKKAALAKAMAAQKDDEVDPDEKIPF